MCELDGFMYVIGGAESWNCLNSVERYNPENNTWTLIAPMNIARRGAGVAVHEGTQRTNCQYMTIKLVEGDLTFFFFVSLR